MSTKNEQQIEWRRSKVVELRARGLSQTEIAHELQVSKASISLISFTSTSMGIDPGYGSSAFGIVVTQWVDDVVQIIHVEEYHRPDYNEMLSTVYGLMVKYKVDKRILMVLILPS